MGFKDCVTDPSLFNLQRSPTMVYLFVYVDDIFVSGFDEELVNDLIDRLGKELSIRDLGDLMFFLGLQM